MKISQSITKRLSYYVIGATIILSLIMSLADVVASLIVIKEQVDITAATTLKNVVKDIEEDLSKVQFSVKNLSELVSENADDADKVETAIMGLLSFNESIIGSTVAFLPGKAPGNRILYAPYSFKDPVSGNLQIIDFAEDDGYFYTSKEWFTVPRDSGKPHWTEPYFDEGGGGQLMTTYCFPLKEENGDVFAVLTADVSLDDITESLVELHPNENSFIFILSKAGDFVSDESYSGLLNTSIFDYAEKFDNKGIREIGERMIAGESGSYQYYKEDGERSLAIYGPLSNGWSVSLVCQYSDFYNQVNTYSIVIALLSILGLLCLYLVDRRIINSVTMPITEFSYAAMNIAKGNFSASIPTVDTNDELKSLENALTYMEQSISSYIRELRQATASNERFESELTIASQIQMQMLPSEFPNREDLELYALVKPAKEVGGDLFDFIEIDDKLYFIVGDVSGKGVSAALYMTIVISMFRFLCRMNLPVREIVTGINESVSAKNERGMFVTLFVGCLDIRTQELQYCNAGHNPIIVMVPGDETKYMVEKPNLAAGLFEDFKYVGESVQLKAGSRLFIYSDGVSEAENKLKELYGEERLLNFFKNNENPLSEKSLIEGLLNSIKEFTDGNDQNDDITMMSIYLKNDMKKRFDPIKDKSSDIIEYLMSSPFIPNDESLKFKIRLSIEEAVENIVRYAYEDGIGWLEACISIDDSGLELTIVLKDAGVKFNPLEKPDPDLTLSAEERGIGGLGIFLCKQLMDHIDYKYEDGCNYLTMKKKCS